MVESGSLSAMPTGWLLADGQTVASADYPDLFTAIGTIHGGDATNFQVPDESANGYVFIKSLPDTISNPSFKVEGLNATVNGSAIGEGDAFSPIADDVVIAAPIPGFEANDTAVSNATFTTQATYTKFWVTGSGSTGGAIAGGSAATVYGVLSAPIGTTVTYTVGEGQNTSRTAGEPSFISVGGVELARSNGAAAPARDSWASTNGSPSNGGSFLEASANDYVLAVHMLSGAYGGMDTSSGDEEVQGNASFWGGGGSPGASNHSVGSDSFANTADGMVKFEWGM
jgi:hypothetical protein